MSKQELFKQYKKYVDHVRKSAKNVGLSEQEINEIFRECFSNLKCETTSSKFCNKQTKAQKYLPTTIKLFVILILFALFIYVLLNVHQTTSSIVLRNVQGLTYPALKVVRILSVPIIKVFPFFTDLYDESCLLENPYFYVADIECWPCKNVHSVIDLTGVDDKNTFKTASGTPFIVKTSQKPVTFKSLQETYVINNQILDSESRRMTSSNSSIKNPKDLFSSGYQMSLNKLHIQWHINKMAPARIIRKLFPRPFFLSDRSGQSVERFLMIDEPLAEPYMLPNTECSYVFLIQGSGERNIILKPSNECAQDCRTVSVLLKPSYVLWYNWWYWKPISLPVKNATSPSITYINSYC